MASRWNVTPTTIHSNGSRVHRTALSDPSASPPWQEPPPLEDSCAKYIISVMALVMRQAAPSDMPLMLQTRSTDISFRDFDVTPRGGISDHSPEKQQRPHRSAASLPAMSATYENTHMSLVKSPSSVNQLLAKYAGRVVFHVSASNWLVVSERLQSKITNLAATEKDISDLVDLQLLAHCLMDRARLLHLLHRMLLAGIPLKADFSQNCLPSSLTSKRMRSYHSRTIYALPSGIGSIFSLKNSTKSFALAARWKALRSASLTYSIP